MSLQKKIFSSYDQRMPEDERQLENHRQFIRDLFRSAYYPHMKGFKHPKVLEIGCNKGFMLQAAAEAFPQGTFIGLDLSPADIAYADAHKAAGTQVTFECADFFEWKEKCGGGTDVLICKDVMEHIDKDRQETFIRAVYDMLNDGGVALVQVPNMDWLFSNHERYMDFTHEIGYTRESFFDVFRIVFGSDNVRVLPASYIFRHTWKQKIVFGIGRPLLLKLMRFGLKFLGEGAADVWFMHREILAVVRK